MESVDQVVVITGASSGIGRATALEFAKKGARVVLSGRDQDALKETEAECTSLGAQTLSVVCDVTNPDQVESLASRAEETFGHLDVWVNNAGIAMFAKFDEAPIEDYHRVIETDFFGYVHGARSALKRFKAQGSGLLVNIDSPEGIVPKPFTSAYSAAKHAVMALTSSIRMELALDGFKDIHVSTVIPSSVETPLVAHAANYTGRAIQAEHTEISPQKVAAAITSLVDHPKRQLIVGAPAKSYAASYMLAPSRYEHRAQRGLISRTFLEDEAEPYKGNLYEPTSPHALLGDWTHQEHERTNTAKRFMPFLAIAGVALVGAAAVATAMLTSKRAQNTNG
jgi:NAD(P)-dependent dehydrogenase (short-subunit alcohol dehydrogenase family)